MAKIPRAPVPELVPAGAVPLSDPLGAEPCTLHNRGTAQLF